MALRRVQVSGFRCLHSTHVELDPRFTLISGPNASGKTSLLEAMYVLGRGRSFRTRRLEHLIQVGAEQFVIFGEADLGGRRAPLGIEGSRQGIHARLEGERVRSLADLAAVLPIQIIDPEVHRLIEEGPHRRRRFLDWGVFHVEQAFVERWQRYNQILKQRNAALRSQQTRPMVAAWDVELVQLAHYLHNARTHYIAALTECAFPIAKGLLGMELSLRYRSGWARDTSFAEALEASWGQDQETGFTQVGPHRAELIFRLDESPVKDRISRGQQKLLAASLLIAQLNLFPKESSLRPTLLLDDPAAELDQDRLCGLINEVGRQAVQLVVTSLDPQFNAFGTPGRRYSLDRGIATER